MTAIGESRIRKTVKIFLKINRSSFLDGVREFLGKKIEFFEKTDFIG